ncbi:3-deoxy-7-phosphoheptulonate synthase [Actinoalloteichus caeruleus]|uniref:Phospho-2-dehydro-3-deoxyheptonate aldolase n=1 Tax=Actinoalloteichus caeruleus DSM 43889 TaxID=1120930 RepID=A0ABT1JEK5_ACTCY|nr:3-deoxy-7-phosphoheptulonate synthase [Actinoalloteichus caeruleus]MCP2330927.1 3-deoxy-D-arabinoheptulosonate-7-phosphate synthase [Actinoalloteichus caeruleus DSM 43889]
MTSGEVGEAGALPVGAVGRGGFPAGVDWHGVPALQQPDWRWDESHAPVLRALEAAEPLVTGAEVRELSTRLAAVCSGDAVLVQAGDCAESFHAASDPRTDAVVAVLDRLAAGFGGGRPVLRVGRIGGQFAKPRSRSEEVVDGVPLPPFRGHLVNSEIADARARRPDPRRMLTGYRLAASAHRRLAAHRASRPDGWGPWSSHEALVLDYESAFLRPDDTGELVLGSTHFPWVGERTRQLDHGQVRLVASAGNPVACKLGPGATGEDVVRLCEVLNPDRTPGRLTFVVRMGVPAITSALPPLLRAVRAVHHPVVWVSDPMHANTVAAPGGRKTRFLTAMVEEVGWFTRIVRDHGEHAGGLHLEVAAEEVTECVGGPVPDVEALDARYETLCDPRLSPAQAAELVARAGF